MISGLLTFGAFDDSVLHPSPVCVPTLRKFRTLHADFILKYPEEIYNINFAAYSPVKMLFMEELAPKGSPVLMRQFVSKSNFYQVYL